MEQAIKLILSKYSVEEICAKLISVGIDINKTVIEVLTELAKTYK